MRVSSRATRHLEDLRRYLRECGVDPLDSRVLEAVARAKGREQTLNAEKGERARWYVTVHFRCCAKVRYVLALADELVLVTVHPYPRSREVHAEL